jgi:hypothetical protein
MPQGRVPQIPIKGPTQYANMQMYEGSAQIVILNVLIIQLIIL